MKLTKAELAFWEQWRGETFTCCHCGRRDSASYVQPQFNQAGIWLQGFSNPEPGKPKALCAACISYVNDQARAENKRRRDADPRCEVPGCKARGNYRAGAVLVLLCGRHLRTVRIAHQRTMAGAGGMALFLPPPDYTREELIGMATRNEAAHA